MTKLTLPLRGAPQSGQPPIVSIFDEVRRSFIQNLCPQHHLAIDNSTTPESLISSIHQWAVIKQNRQKGKKYLLSLRNLSDALKPYFRVIDLFVNSNPEYMSLFWGGLNLVLQLASNYVSFFEKLTKSLDRIAKVLPVYCELEGILSTQQLPLTPVIVTSLGQVYRDIFVFLQNVIDIFSKPDGRKRSTMAVAGSLAFTSFETRFDVILQNLQHHKEDLKLEINVLTLRLTSDEVEKRRCEHTNLLAAQRLSSQSIHDSLDFTQTSIGHVKMDVHNMIREATLQRIRDWISAPCYASEFEEALRHRDHGTGFWIFEDERFERWHKPRQLVNDESRTDQDNFKHKSTDEILDKFCFAMSESPSGQKTATLNELQDLFKLCLVSFEDMSIIFDGVDECTDAERLIEELLICRNTGTARLLVLSRLNVATLFRMVPDQQTVSMKNDGQNDDIRRFSRRKIEALKKQRLIDYTASVDELTEHLVQGAGHMFLWARLMIMFLRSPVLTPKQRLNILNNINLPEGLEFMYTRILLLISQLTDLEIRFAMAVFEWLATARRTLADTELREAVKYGRIGSHFDDNDDYANSDDFRYAVIMSCGGLVESTSSTDCQFQFIHLSAREFVVSLQTNPEKVPVELQKYFRTETEANLQLATICLRYLTWTIPQKMSYEGNEQRANTKLRNSNAPLTSYTSEWWIEHLTYAHDIRKIQPDDMMRFKDGIMAALKSFLSEHISIMAWIEASYSIHRSAAGNTTHEARLAKLSRWCEYNYHHRLQDSDSKIVAVVEMCQQFCIDLNRLHDALGSNLEKSPALIWNEAPAFVPSSFWLASKSTSVKCLNPIAEKNHEDSQSALITVSESMLSNNLLAVLSIWPPRAFELYWDKVNNKILLSELYSYCKGWKARLEIFSTSSNQTEKLFERSIDLLHSEVWLAIHQSLRKEAAGNWRFQFPISISANLQTFMILQTVYLARPSQENKVPTQFKLSSRALELDILLNLKGQWWELSRQPPKELTVAKRGGPRDNGTFYTYKFILDPTGRLAYFVDFHQLQQSTLAVVAIDSHGGMDVLSKLTTSPEWDEDKVVFHPSRPLLFIYRNRKIKVWQYTIDSNPSELLDFYNPRCGHHDGLQDMTLSECGNYLAMFFPKRPPILKEIPQATVSEKHYCDEKPVSKKAKTDLISKCEIAAGAVLKGVNVDLDDEIGRYHSIGISKTAYGVEIRKWAGDSSKTMEVQQQLTSLPKSESIEDASVSVRWPSGNEQNVKIVLGQRSRKYYSHATAEVSRTGPMVIQRDLQSLNPPVSKTLNSNAAMSRLLGEKRAVAAVESDDELPPYTPYP